MVEKRVLLEAGRPAATLVADAGQEPCGVAGDVDVAEATAFTADDLQEFLEADLAGDPAEPTFKVRLRETLWEMVQRRAGVRSPDER